MEIIAQSKYIRSTPRKIKLVVDTLKGLSIDEALTRLKFLKKKAAKPVILVLNQATSNATNNFNLNKDNLNIKKIIVGKGPIMKRWRAGARGRVKPFTKRTSHLTIILEEAEKREINKKGD
jgi:large subunit ribosomal protein L22